MLLKVLAAGILAASLAMAQGGMGRGGGMGGDEGGGGGMGGGRGGSSMDIPNISGARPSRFDQLTQVLKLNKDQKKEVKNVLDEAQKEANPVRDQLSKSRVAIGDAIQAGKNPDEINQLVQSEATLQSQMAGIELNAFAKIFKGLDKDQQANTRTVFQMMKGMFNGKNWNTEE